MSPSQLHTHPALLQGSRRRVEDPHDANALRSAGDRLRAALDALGEMLDQKSEGFGRLQPRSQDVAGTVRDQSSTDVFRVCRHAGAAVVDLDSFGDVELVVQDTAT